jgi:hypothetical protein
MCRIRAAFANGLRPHILVKSGPDIVTIHAFVLTLVGVEMSCANQELSFRRERHGPAGSQEMEDRVGQRLRTREAHLARRQTLF